MKSKRSTKPARPVTGRPTLFPAGFPTGIPRARVTALVLITFTVMFVALQVGSYTRTSATFDEPGGLAAGYAALAFRDYRPALEHPPLTRLWAALPLLTMSGVSFDSKALDDARPEAVAFQGPFASGHRFLYAQDGVPASSRGDALLYRARFMNVLLAVVLGVLVYCWVAEWLGFRAAVVALGLYTIEPNIAAHAALVTTDLGVACFMFGAILLPLATLPGRDAVEHRWADGLLRPRDAEQVLGGDSRSGCARAPGDDGLAPPHVVCQGCRCHRRAARRRNVARGLGGVWLSLCSEHDAWLGVRAPRQPGRAARRAVDRRRRWLDRLVSPLAECLQRRVPAWSGTGSGAAVFPGWQLQ